MNKIQLTTYKSIIGSLALETVNNPNNPEDVKSKDWFKNLYLELNHKETQIKCETQDGYKELQKKIYHFIGDMIEIIGE